MKPSNLLSVALSSLALAFVACSGSSTPDAGPTTTHTLFGNNGGNTGGSSTGGGGTTGGAGGSSGGSSGGSTGGCSLGAGPTGDVCFFAAVDAGPVALPDAGPNGDAGPAQLGSSCNPNANTDTCATYGLACALNPNDPTGMTGFCDIPSEYGTCTTAVGCQAPYTCVDTSKIFSGSTNTCIQACTGSATCLNAQDACFQVSATASYCVTDICGPEAVALSGQANGTGYFQPCNNVSTNDGTCLPALFQNPADGGSIVGGVCQPTGAAASGAGCSVARTADGGPFCAAGNLCVGVDPTAQCFPLCAVDQAACGASCPSSTACGALGGGLDLGICFQSCTSSSTCGTLSCLNPNG